MSDNTWGRSWQTAKPEQEGVWWFWGKYDPRCKERGLWLVRVRKNSDGEWSYTLMATWGEIWRDNDGIWMAVEPPMLLGETLTPTPYIETFE